MPPMLRLFGISMVFTCNAALAGCAAEAADDDDEAATDAAELSAAGKALVGSYEGGGNIERLELAATEASSGNAFTAELDTGVRCITAPCAAARLRVDGTFTAGAKTITFKTSDPSPAATRFAGRYRYTASGSTLTLSRAGAVESLAKAAPPAPGPIGTCATGTFTRDLADRIQSTVAPVSGNTDRFQAPAFKRELARFQGRTWRRGADGRWSWSPASLDGLHGGLYLGDARQGGAFEIVIHAKTSRYVSASSSIGELRRYVFFQGAFDARLGSADVGGPVSLAGKLSESPWGSFGSAPAPLTFSGPVRFTDHCFSMLDAPLTPSTTEVHEAFATF